MNRKLKLVIEVEIKHEKQGRVWSPIMLLTEQGGRGGKRGNVL
jgi:hypothetical protein